MRNGSSKSHLVRLILSLGVVAGLAPWVVAVGPAWWRTRGAIPPSNINTPENDFAALNQGQLKNLGTAAFDEMEATLPGGAGPDVTALVKSWHQVDPGTGAFILDGAGKRIPKVTTNTADFAAVNIGQLKKVAAPFIARLQQAGVPLPPTVSAPVTGNQDFAMANIGQAKNLFSFNAPQDSDADGIPDSWETANGLDPHDAIDALMDHDSDGWVALSEYERGTNPHDPYDGTAPPGIPAAPSNVVVLVHPDGSKDISWDDNSNNETYFVIRVPGPNGTEVEVGRVGVNQRSFHIPAPETP